MPEITRADWVITGGTAVDGSVVLIASTKLVMADLDMRRQEHKFAGWDEFQVYFAPIVTLAVQMKQFHMVTAATYAEALQILLNEWTPDQQSTLEIQR